MLRLEIEGNKAIGETTPRHMFTLPTLENDSKYNGRTRPLAQNYGFQSNLIADNQSYSNLNQRKHGIDQAQSKGIIQTNATSKESRCIWNKFSYGAEQTGTQNKRSEAHAMSQRGHTYGASSYEMDNRISKEPTTGIQVRLETSGKVETINSRNSYTKNHPSERVANAIESRGINQISVLIPKQENKESIANDNDGQKSDPSLSALERSKLRVANMKENPIPNKGEEENYHRDTSFIWRRPVQKENLPYPAYTNQHKEKELQERANNYLMELDKKYNPEAAKLNLQREQKNNQDSAS